MRTGKFLLIMASVALLGTGCSKFGDTNVNPNATTTPSTAALLTNVEAQLGGIASQTRGGLYAQYFSETQYTEVSLYALPKLDFDGTYSGPLFDLQNIIIYNTDEDKIPSAAKFGSAGNQIAIARILKAYIFWGLTDRWGDIPYSEALQGKENLTPKFDTQESIYKDLLKELTEAQEQFDAGKAAVGDFLYKGDAGQWKKLANSLRMLIALRLSKKYPDPSGYAATEFAAAYNDADGFMESNEDNLQLNYPGTAAFRNPWFNLYNGRTDFAESDVVFNLLADLGDPRTAAFGGSNTPFPYGLTRPQATDFANSNPSYAKVLAGTYQAAAAPVVVIGYPSVALAVAEAGQRGWIATDVEGYYADAIASSWDQWDQYDADDFADYIAQSEVDLSTGNALQKIQLQQYFAWYPDGAQAWANWRRTGVPALTPTPNATNAGGQIPRRYTYGQNAYSLNAANTAAAVAALPGGDTPDSRVWWDQ
jgi:hypothetical protein